MTTPLIVIVYSVRFLNCDVPGGLCQRSAARVLWFQVLFEDISFPFDPVRSCEPGVLLLLFYDLLSVHFFCLL